MEKAYEASKLLHLCRGISLLSEPEKHLLQLIAKKGEIQAGELYKSFHELTQLGYTRFYGIVNRLQVLNYVDADFTGKGQRGRTRIIKTKYEPEDILNCFEKKPIRNFNDLDSYTSTKKRLKIKRDSKTMDFQLE